MSQTEDNKALMRDYLDGFWNRNDESVAARTVAVDAIFHDFEDSPVALPQGLAGVKAVRRQFGEGVVVACEGLGERAKLTVQFRSAGMKKILAAFAELSHAD